MDKRDFKTHPQQWSAIVDFGEEHPIIFRPQFKQVDGDARESKELWENLAQSLNSMGVGFRTVEKWKLAIGRWKSKVKAKAAQLRIESQKTGGGPSNAVPLTDLEVRLMSLLGWKAVTGDGDAELGMGKIQTITTRQPLAQLQIQTQPKEYQNATKPTSPESQPSSSSAGLKRPAYSLESPPPLASLTSSKDKEPARKRSRLISDKSRRYVSVAKMHKETMEEAKKLRAEVTRQAIAQEAMVGVLKDILEYAKSKND